jgi:hypothetical protein
MGMNVIKDPKLYRKMSEPFESDEEANAAAKGFFEELRSIREKYGIPDVLAVIKISIEQGESESIAFSIQQIGDIREGEGMAAYAYGCLRSDNRKLIERLLGDHAKTLQS